MPHQYTIEPRPKSQKILTIAGIDQKVLEKAEEKVFREFSQNLNISGFRPGKIPETVIRQHISNESIASLGLEKAIPMAAEEILKTEQVLIIGSPRMELESSEPLKVTIIFDVFPQITVGDYKKISVPVQKKKVTADDIEQTIKDIQKRFTEYRAVERPAIKGDRVEIDFEGKDAEGKPIPNSASKHHPVILGSNLLIPGFEDQITGMKAGEKKSFPLTFPKDYHVESLRQKEAIFDATLHKVEEAHVPEVNDELIEKMTGKKQAVEEWKKVLEQDLQQELDLRQKKEVEEKYFQVLVKMTTGDLPDTMIREEKNIILGELKENILRFGFSYERYLQSVKKSEEDLIKGFDRQAEDRIRLRMALEQIAKKENIEISDIEVEEHLNELTKDAPQDREKVKKNFQAGTPNDRFLRYQLRMKKTLEKILPRV